MDDLIEEYSGFRLRLESRKLATERVSASIEFSRFTQVRVPALRKRPEDVRDLAAYFLSEFCTRNNFRSKAIEDEVVSALERYEWPGNVRELRNAVERMAILNPGSQITLESVPMEIRSPAAPAERGLQGIRDAAERDRIVHALEQTSWNVSGAARLLGVERTCLHKRIRALGLSRE